MCACVCVRFWYFDGEHAMPLAQIPASWQSDCTVRACMCGHRRLPAHTCACVAYEYVPCSIVEHGSEPLLLCRAL